MALSQWKEAILEGIFMEIEDGVVEEKNLERLENLVEILHKEGSKVPESVKEAYCKVAVECTVKCLSYEKDAKKAYTEAMKSIWLGRIMPLCDKVSCLVTRDLLNSCKRLWMAHSDVKACKSLMDENIKEKALVSLRKVVSELNPNLNPNIDESEEIESSEESEETEPMVEARENEVTEAMDESEEIESSEESEETESMVEARENEVTEAMDESEEIESSEESEETESMVEARENEVTEAMDEDQESPADTELETPTSEGSKAEPLPRKIKTISSSVVDRELRKLRARKVELVNALEKGKPSTLNNESITEQEDDVADPSATIIATKRSLMERRSTAHTYEWEDSIDDSDQEPSDGGERNNKAKRKKIIVSPLKKSPKCGRRKQVPWTTAETLAVMKGYEKHGTNWKLIKDENPILERRTNVDIKDRYRVAMRRAERHP